MRAVPLRTASPRRPRPVVAATCSLVRETLSARLDGECGVLSATACAVHLDDCESCRRFGAEVEPLARRARLESLDRVPDLTAAIVSRTVAAGKATPWPGRVRPLLGWATIRWSAPVVALAAALPAVGFGVLGHAVVVPAHTLSPCMELLHHLHHAGPPSRLR